MLILAIVILHAAVLANGQRKIVGGVEAQIQSFPYQAFMEITFSERGQLCGAAILDKTTLLTAAHCIYDPDYGDYESSYARVGSTDKYEGGQQINVAKVIAHPEYDPIQMSNDIAIIKLDAKIRYNGNVQPIALARSIPPPGSKVSVAGWGALAEAYDDTPDILSAMTVPIVAKNRCLLYYKDVDIPIHRKTFCAGKISGGTDACQGDSGGPAVFQGEQVGIVSWGSGCARKNKVTIYTDVTKYKSFIRKHM